jgi:hypothetical protein
MFVRMEREWLKEQLEAGRSMEAIAREVGKAPSTVAYWVNRHGLVSAHAERHAGKGRIDAEVLADMAATGMSIRAMAAELGRSYAAVRHWLLKHGIQTQRAVTLGDTADARSEGLDETMATCPTHGWTRYIRRSVGAFRCARCRQEAVSRHRRAMKRRLIDEAGGCCARCGYSDAPAALHFHHLDPATKSFAVSRRGATVGYDVLKAEAAKCVLLCANCHAEVEAGTARLPFPGAPEDSPG